MAIYSEDEDPNTIVKSSEEVHKECTIAEIIKNIKATSSFTIADIEADISPYLDSKGRLSHLVEEFREDGCVIKVYDPNYHNSDEIDAYDEFYEALEISQLELINKYSFEWVEYMNE